MKNSENRFKFIGGKIREARDEIGWSQLKLAQAIGFTSGTAISLIEAGEREVSVDDLEKIADLFHKPIHFFLGKEEKIIDMKMALRAEKNLSPTDEKTILDFIDFVKKRHGGTKSKT